MGYSWGEGLRWPLGALRRHCHVQLEPGFRVLDECLTRSMAGCQPGPERPPRPLSHPRPLGGGRARHSPYLTVTVLGAPGRAVTFLDSGSALTLTLARMRVEPR